MCIFECTQSRLYEENTRYSYQINEAIKNCLVNETYFKKYSIVKKTAERSCNMKKKLLNEIKQFNQITFIKNNIDLNEKRKIYCHLEIEVNNIKNETLKFQKEVENFLVEIIEKEKIISLIEKKNKLISKEIQNILRQKYEIKIKMLQIYNNFQVFDLVSIIKKYKEERIQYQGYYKIVKKYILKKISFLI